MGGVGAQRPVWHANDPKKTGALNARARTRGQNPLVIEIYSAAQHNLFKPIYAFTANVETVFGTRITIVEKGKFGLKALRS